MSPIYLCAINNILSGTCQEDCKFCTQSVRYNADIQRYSYKDLDTILQEAKQAKSNGALGYCLVTAGKGLDDKKVEFVARAASLIKNEVNGLNIIACNGTANIEQLCYLKDNGVDSYNHNLETSSRYYSEICQTHTWSERYETCENVKLSGLMLCCGGIFGMGEEPSDRIAMIDAISSLDPESIPLNFYHPNKALPLKQSNIDYKEALNIISTVRQKVGNKPMVMVAGGRELMFTTKEKEMFEAGANAIVIGDYLTTSGAIPNSDVKMVKELGYTIASACEEKINGQ